MYMSETNIIIIRKYQDTILIFSYNVRLTFNVPTGLYENVDPCLDTCVTWLIFLRFWFNVHVY